MGRHKKPHAEPDINLESVQQLYKLKNTIKNANNTEPLPAGQVSENDLFLYGPPVSPQVFIESEEYYGNKEKKNIYPWIIDDLTEIFSGKYYAPKYQTVIELLGTGSGKSYFAGMADAYMIYWLLSFKSLSKFFALQNISWDDSATISFMNMAPRADQAKDIVFQRINHVVSACKIFQERNWMPNPNVKTQLQFEQKDPRTGLPYTKLQVVPGNSSATFSLGYNIWGGIIDEANFFIEKNSNPVVKIYEEMSNRRFSRFQNNGLMILTSSANLETDITEELGQKAKTDSTIFFRRRSRYECKPDFFGCERFSFYYTREKEDGTQERVKLTPPKMLEQQYIDNKAKALRDIDAIPALASSPLYPDYALLMSKVNMNRHDPFPDLGMDKPEGPKELRKRIPPNFFGVEGATYRIHIDLAKGNAVKNNCGVGMAMCHKIADAQLNFKVKLDMGVRFKAPHDQETVDIGDLLDLIKFLKMERKFNIDMVTFDQYNSILPIQIINKWGIGIVSEQLSVAYEHHTYLKTLIMCGQMDMFFDTNLIYELKRMEDDGKFVYPAVGAFMDEATAVAGAAYAVSALIPKHEEEEVMKPRTTRGVGIPRSGGGGFPQGAVSIPKYKTNFTPKYRR